jgi:hypothetical protein
MTGKPYPSAGGRADLRAIERSGWTPEYSRKLRADNLRFSEELITYGNLAGRFLYVDLRNARPDIAALEATGRLCELGQGQDLQPSLISSPLKANGAPGLLTHHLPSLT